MGSPVPKNVHDCILQGCHPQFPRNFLGRKLFGSKCSKTWIRISSDLFHLYNKITTTSTNIHQQFKWINIQKPWTLKKHMSSPCRKLFFCPVVEFFCQVWMDVDPLPNSLVVNLGAAWVVEISSFPLGMWVGAPFQRFPVVLAEGLKLRFVNLKIVTQCPEFWGWDFFFLISDG